jgi:hypothetical protein
LVLSSTALIASVVVGKICGLFDEPRFLIRKPFWSRTMKPIGSGIDIGQSVRLFEGRDQRGCFRKARKMGLLEPFPPTNLHGKCPALGQHFPPTPGGFAAGIGTEHLGLGHPSALAPRRDGLGARRVRALALLKEVGAGACGLA